MTRILIVEDSEQNAKLAREVLGFKGYTAEVATSGEAALARLHKEVFDVILMDVQLPGMDGLTVTRALKSDRVTRDIPVIGLSALARHEDRDRALAAGCSGYVSKPYRIRDLVAAIEAALLTPVG